jgi:hypothetical protein
LSDLRLDLAINALAEGFDLRPDLTIGFLKLFREGFDLPPDLVEAPFESFDCTALLG